MTVDSAVYTPSMSDDAVKAKTGKTWPEWFAALDSAGCKQKSHPQIVAVLREEHGVGSWWQQMVTVEYERSRGLRAVHQKCDGDFSANISRTINVDLPALYQACADEKQRTQWLPNPITIRKANEHKSIRATMPDSTSVQIMFYAKGDGKSQVTIEHNKLADSADVAKRKEYWKAALDKLTALLVGER